MADSNARIELRSYVLQSISQSAEVIAALKDQIETIDRIAQCITERLLSGHKLLTAGNGGSAAEAMHLAQESTGKYSRADRKPLAAICLCADATALTCIGNDWDFASVFSRQVEALAKPGDMLVVFSSSGNSENLIRACSAIKAAGGLAIGLLGKGGGRNLPLCDMALVIPSQRTACIQEAQQVVLHLILEYIDRLCP